MDRDLYLFFDTETTGLPLDYNAPDAIGTGHRHLS